MPILSLIARLGLDGRGFKAGMREASHEAGRFGKELKSTLAAGFTAGAYIELVKSIKESILHIKDMSEQFGLSTDQVQAMDHAMKRTGLTFEDFGASVIKIGSARQAAAEGNEKLLDTFEALGIGIDKLNDSSLSDFDLEMQMAKSFREGNESIKQRIMLHELLGRSGQKLMESLKQFDPNNGVDFSKSMIDQTHETAKAFDRMWEKIKAGYAWLVLNVNLGPSTAFKKWMQTPSKVLQARDGQPLPEEKKPEKPASKEQLFEDEALKEKRKAIKSKIEDATVQLLPRNQQRDEYERRARMHLKNAQIIDDDKDPRVKKIALEEREKALDYINKFAGMNEPNQIHSDALSRIGGFVGGGGGPQSIESQHLAVARAMLNQLRTGILIKGES